jgi:Flp pilus assembly protein TadD
MPSHGVGLRGGDFPVCDGPAAISRLLAMATRPWAFLRRGDAHRMNGELDDAIYDLTRAIELEPARAASYASRGEAYRAKRDFKRAATDYRIALAFNPNQPTALKGMSQLRGR